MKRMTKIGIYGMAVWMFAACGNGVPDYDATGTFEATEVTVSAEASGKLLRLEVEEGTRLKAGEEVGLVDTCYQTTNSYGSTGKETGGEPACCRSC